MFRSAVKIDLDSIEVTITICTVMEHYEKNVELKYKNV